jgi:hypothetical protein
MIANKPETANTVQQPPGMHAANPPRRKKINATASVVREMLARRFFDTCMAAGYIKVFFNRFEISIHSASQS